MESLSVRRLNVSDIDRVKSIYSESFGQSVSSINYNGECIYVACVNEEIAGLCMVNYIDDIFVSNRIAFINNVCVSKKYRGLGIARFMLEEVEKILISDGVNEIMLTSSSKRVVANKLYKNLGFSIYETNVFKKKLS